MRGTILRHDLDPGGRRRTVASCEETEPSERRTVQYRDGKEWGRGSSLTSSDGTGGSLPADSAAVRHGATLVRGAVRKGRGVENGKILKNKCELNRIL